MLQFRHSVDLGSAHRPVATVDHYGVERAPSPLVLQGSGNIQLRSLDPVADELREKGIGADRNSKQALAYAQASPAALTFDVDRPIPPLTLAAGRHVNLDRGATALSIPGTPEGLAQAMVFARQLNADGPTNPARAYEASVNTPRGLHVGGTAPTPAGSASSVADHVANQQPVMQQAAAAAGADVQAAATTMAGEATPPAAPPGASGEQAQVKPPAADKSAVELGYDFMERPLAGYLQDAAQGWGWKADHAKLLEQATAAALATGVGGAGLYAALQGLQQPTAPVVVTG